MERIRHEATCTIGPIDSGKESPLTQIEVVIIAVVLQTCNAGLCLPPRSFKNPEP